MAALRARIALTGRVTILILLLVFVVGCVHVRDPWAAGDEAEARRMASADLGRICQVRIESAYDAPVTLAYRAGPHALSLGTVEPDEVIQVGVPCEEDAIVVYTVWPRIGARDLWINPTRGRLDPLAAIHVVVRSPAGPRG